MIRAFVLLIGFLALGAFTTGQQAALQTACADSLANSAKNGRRIPPALVLNKDAVCACLKDGIVKDKAIPDAEKPKITEVMILRAAGDYKKARELSRSLDKSVDKAMRRLSPVCTRQYLKPKTDEKKN